MVEGNPSKDLPVGRRVAYWRSRRNLTQQSFADRLGKSKSWVEKIERGARALDRFSVLQEIAAVLRIDVGQLLDGEADPAAAGGRHAGRLDLEALRAVLERYAPAAGPPDESPSPSRLRQAVDHAWLTFQHGGYDTLTRLLPKLLAEAQAADAYHGSSDDDGPAVAHLLAQVYQVASSTLRKLGAYDSAWLAADRAMAVAARCGDPLLAGVAACRTGNALLALGRPRTALELHLTFANRLAPAVADADPDRLSVHGALLLQAAMAAARLGDNATVADLLREAERSAALLGADENRYWTSFGPTNVELHRAAAEVELGEGGRAVEVHDAIDPLRFAALLPERRAQHLLDVARGYGQYGDAENAGRMLLAGERLAPAEIRHRPDAHQLVAEIVRRSRGRPPASVADLARRMRINAI
ncbi:helix-turn-helix domain-containing protein [Micromonospora sp. NPDC049559]|uniref:helix-turn-helix domain-containing protein n=1 Tax=Micromonospora sp. NPDC049559 TaxID=3155923 RepID=UPI0034360B0B